MKSLVVYSFASFRFFVWALFFATIACQKPLPFSSDVSEAIQHNHSATVRMFIDHGLDPNCRAPSGDTPLLVAARKADPEILTMLLEAGARPNDSNDKKEYPLNVALERGNLENIDLLLKAGANPNLTDAAGLNGLFYLSRGTYPEPERLGILRKLLARGSRANTLGGSTLLEESMFNNQAVTEALMAAGARIDPVAASKKLLDAAAYGNPKVGEFLLRLGANPNERFSRDGSTPLILTAINATCGKASRRAHDAARPGRYLEMVKLLLATGADVNLHYRQPGNTALAIAERCGRESTYAAYADTESFAVIKELQQAQVAQAHAANSLLRAALQALKEPQPLRKAPPPERYIRDIGALAEDKDATFEILNLSDGPSAELLVTSTGDWCGTGGCNTRIYGLRGDRYELLAGENQLFGYKVRPLRSTTNEYKDLVLEGRNYIHILKFNGNRYACIYAFESDNSDLYVRAPEGCGEQ